MGASSCNSLGCLLLGLLLARAHYPQEMDSPPGPLFRIDQCNFTRARGVPVPDPCVRPNCALSTEGGRQRVHRRMLHSRSQVMFFIKEWEMMQGFLALESAFFMHLMSVLQNDAGISGSVGEIGIAAGKSFITMALTRRLGEPLFACDLFGGGEEADNAADFLGGKRKQMLVEHLVWANISVDDVLVHDGSSVELWDTHLLQATGGVGFRLFHVDGGHLAKYTYHDITIAACALVEGGIIMVDDLFSSNWMGVSEGFHRFMHNQRRILQTLSGDLVPFLCLGRIYLTHKRFANAYRTALRASFPEGTFASKEMYGSEVLLFKSKGVYHSGFFSYLEAEEAFFGY